MRVLLCVHHRLDADQGAPGATLALGQALAGAGCRVDYLAYDHVFGPVAEEQAGHQLRFPWLAARELRRRAGDFDVVDASTGDAWVWATLGRPGARIAGLVTRAHGLEHLADEAVRRATQEAGRTLSWKYPLYHGGLRLWEVRRSLRASDHCILLNPRDHDYVHERLGVDGDRLSVIPNGIADRFFDAPGPQPVEGPLRLAFIGRWSEAKGAPMVVEAATRLEEHGVEFALTLLGTMDDAEPVLATFPSAVRPRVSVTPRFANERLPDLLAGHELFVFPSQSEGSSGALLEAMACGLAAVATPVGSAPELLRDGEGVLVDAHGVPDTVCRLAADRQALLEMRRAAQRAASGFRWSHVAEQTIAVYERALTLRLTTGWRFLTA